jgi:hypothetical protein
MRFDRPPKLTSMLRKDRKGDVRCNQCPCSAHVKGLLSLIVSTVPGWGIVEVKDAVHDALEDQDQHGDLHRTGSVQGSVSRDDLLVLAATE